MEQKLFLGGGGSAEDEKFLLQEFYSSLRNQRMLYVPVALSKDSPHFANCENWICETMNIAGAKSDFKIDTVKDLSDFSPEKEYGGIFVGGGNTYRLNALVRESGFEQRICKWIEGGTPLYGGSAGAILLGKSIVTSGDDPGEFDNFQGLNLLYGYNCVCHYSGKNMDEKIQLMVHSQGQPVIAIPETSGVVVNNRFLTVKGNKSCFLFYLNKEKQEVFPDMKIELL